MKVMRSEFLGLRHRADNDICVIESVHRFPVENIRKINSQIAMPLLLHPFLPFHAHSQNTQAIQTLIAIAQNVAA